MIASKKRDATLGVVGGMVAAFTSSALDLEGAARLPLLVVGLALYAWGAASLAQAKGYAAAWGLLAMATLVGVLVLVILRDRRPDGGFSGELAGRLSGPAATAGSPQPGWPSSPGRDAF